MLFSGKGIADDWKKTTKESNFIKNVEANVSENKQKPMNLQFFANKKSPKEIGAVGEDELKKFGGASQVHFDTTKGKRIVDQFVDGTAYESKVGYTLSIRLFGRRGWQINLPIAGWYPFNSVKQTPCPFVK